MRFEEFANLDPGMRKKILDEPDARGRVWPRVQGAEGRPLELRQTPVDSPVPRVSVLEVKR